MTYSIPYIFVLIIFSICAFYYDHVDDDNSKKWVNIVSSFVFFVFFAFRGYVYTDWLSYTEYLDRIDWDELLNWDPLNSKSFEPGFALLTLVCKTVLNDYSFLVFVCTLIDSVLFFRFLRYRKVDNMALAFMLFFTFEGLVIMFNLLRNAISMFIFMNALQYIEKRMPLKYFSLCFLALMFHMSAVIFFPLYFFLHKKLNRWAFLGVAMTCVLFFLSHISIVTMIVRVLGLEGLFGGKVEVYTEYITSSRELSITGLLENLGIVAFVFMYYDEILEKHENHVIIINSLLMFLVMYFVFAEFKTLSSRLSILFYYSYWILWVDVVHVLYLKNNRILLSVLLFLYCSFITIRNIGTPCQEYDNILFGSKSYQERVTILRRTYQEDE